MCFVSGPGAIVRASYRDDRYRVLATYALPPNSGLGGMNDLFHTDDGWWYLTATPGRIVRTRSLAGLARGRFEDVGKSLGLRGTPYYLAQIDGRYYVPQITEHSGIAPSCTVTGGSATCGRFSISVRRRPPISKGRRPCRCERVAHLATVPARTPLNRQMHAASCLRLGWPAPVLATAKGLMPASVPSRPALRQVCAPQFANSPRAEDSFVLAAGQMSLGDRPLLLAADQLPWATACSSRQRTRSPCVRANSWRH